MKLARQIVPGILALALNGTVAAHSVSADDWTYIDGPDGTTPLGGTGTSITVSPSAIPALPDDISLAGITFLSFSPGTGPSNPANSSYFEETRYYNAAVQYQWDTNYQAVSLFATSLSGLPESVDAPVLTVSVGYYDYQNGCGSIVGETASVTVNANTYTAKNPCQLAAGTGDLTFVNGVLKAGTGVGWTLTSTVQAPELDTASAGGGLTLLLGGLLVIRGGRDRPRRNFAPFAVS